MALLAWYLAGLIPGTEPYIDNVEDQLMEHVDDGDKIGEDANEDGQYAGKSLELGKGGRNALLQDKITMKLVEKGHKLEWARAESAKIAKINFLNKYKG